MNDANFIGWDIGGAHLKVAVANSNGKLEFIEQFPLPIWRGVDQLEALIPEVLKILPKGSNCFHTVTVTAELSDVFKSRHEGVCSLIDICQTKMDADIRYYGQDSGLLDLSEAKKKTTQIASANWHVSASYIATLIKSGLFIDVGSTTTDIIPVNNSKLVNIGSDDQSRMRCDELVYTGIIRTSLMALANKAPFNGEWQNIAAENFATTADIYRILSSLEESDDVMDAADGKGKDVKGSYRRLARMLGMDFNNSIDERSWKELAEYFEERQLQLLTASVSRVLLDSAANAKIIGAGAGDFLIKKVADRINVPFSSFSELCDVESGLQHKCNVCAPAVAIALLNKQVLSG